MTIEWIPKVVEEINKLINKIDYKFYCHHNGLMIHTLSSTISYHYLLLCIFIYEEFLFLFIKIKEK